MILWKPCYELPRTCSWWEGVDGDVTVVHPDGKAKSMTSEEFAVHYVSRRPAPGEIRDELQAREAEVERLSAEIERLRARVEVLERLRERIEECEQRRLSADDARKMVMALWGAGFREGELEHRESVSAATLNKAEIESQRCRDAIISALTWGSKP